MDVYFERSDKGNKKCIATFGLKVGLILGRVIRQIIEGMKIRSCPIRL